MGYVFGVGLIVGWGCGYLCDLYLGVGVVGCY